MKKDSTTVFYVLAAMFVVFGSLMLATHFLNDGKSPLLSAAGPFIMSIAMFMLARNSGRAKK